MLIEIFADLVCPWCYIGMHRLDRALLERPRLRTERRWVPFQLNPDLPVEGIDRGLYVAIKFGSRERVRHIHTMVEAAAAQDGVVLNLTRIQRTPNTVNAHRLVVLAGRTGRADAMMRALFAAYFVEGFDLSDREVLTAAATTVGFDATEIRRYLSGDADLDRVRSGDRLSRQLELHAVPFFIFNQRFAMSGAQDPLCFLPLLDIADRETPAMVHT